MTPLARTAAAIVAVSALAALAATAAHAGPPVGPVVIAPGGAGLVTIRAHDAVVVEGDQGTSQLRFAVTLSKPSAAPVEIEVQTSSGLPPTAATKGVDYVALGDQRVFPPGTTAIEVAVNVKGDVVHERPVGEYVALQIVDSSAGVIADDTGWGRIDDNDPVPVLSVGDVTAPEGTGGPTGFHFPVTLSNPSATKVTLNLAAAAGTGDQGNDWQGPPAAVVFAPGETVKAFGVSVVGDAIAEDDETFTVTAADVEGAHVSDGSATGTIEDDDSPDGDELPDGEAPDGGDSSSDEEAVLDENGGGEAGDEQPAGGWDDDTITQAGDSFDDGGDESLLAAAPIDKLAIDAGGDAGDGTASRAPGDSSAGRDTAGVRTAIGGAMVGLGLLLLVILGLRRRPRRRLQ